MHLETIGITVSGWGLDSPLQNRLCTWAAQCAKHHSVLLAVAISSSEKKGGLGGRLKFRYWGFANWGILVKEDSIVDTLPVQPSVGNWGLYLYASG